ncbi:MAG: hypothetical protein WA234_09070, partial [Rectinemataceae bacterium]
VERVVFQGNFQRLVLRLKVSLDTGGRVHMPDVEDEGLIELEIDTSWSIVPGEEVGVDVRPEKCGILPELS